MEFHGGAGNFRRTCGLLVVALGLGVWGSQAGEAPPPEEPGPDIVEPGESAPAPPDEPGPDLQEIVVTATRRETLLSNTPDVMLININKGHDWKSLVIPQVSGGNGDDAYAIDHDRNGLDDFLVLNGHNLKGPTQLIAFYSR